MIPFARLLLIAFISARGITDLPAFKNVAANQALVATNLDNLHDRGVEPQIRNPQFRKFGPTGVRHERDTAPVARAYTLREAAAISTKSHAALRGMVDRGQLKTIGGGKKGRTRRIPHDELKRAGLLKHEEILANSAVQDLGLRLTRMEDEIHETEIRLSAQLSRIEKSLAALLDAQSRNSAQSEELKAA